MSSVGFVPGAVKELETLREAWKTLNDLLKNLANAEACLQKHDLQLTAVHLKVAKWNMGQAKKAIAAVGQAKKNKKLPKASLLNWRNPIESWVVGICKISNQISQKETQAMNW